MPRGSYATTDHGPKGKVQKLAPASRAKYKQEYARQAYILVGKHGFNQVKLAELFEVEKDTIKLWKDQHVEFAKALKKGADIYDSDRIEVALKQKAEGYNYVEVKAEEAEVVVPFDGGADDLEAILKLFPGSASVKNKKGETFLKLPQQGKKMTRTTKHVPAEVRAIELWLINRHPDRWKTTHAVKVDADLNLDGIIDHRISEDMDDGTAAQLYQDLLKGRSETIVTGKQ